MVVELPRCINVPPKFLYLFPSDALFCLVAFADDCIYFSCVMPSVSRIIKYLYRSPAIEFEAVIPPLLWSHFIYATPNSTGGICHTFEFELFEFQNKESKLLKRPYRIGNVNSYGEICWGEGVAHPKNLRQAHLEFFDKQFSGAYCPRSAFHACKNSKEIGPCTSPWYSPDQPCPESTCPCCTKLCKCDNASEYYVAYVKNYDGAKIYDQFQSYTLDLEKFKKVEINQDSFAALIDINLKQITWANRVLDGWALQDSNNLLIKDAEVNFLD